MTEETDSLASADLELAQCEAEVDTLLRIIAELNAKMGALQIQRDLKSYEPLGQACITISDSDSRPQVPQSWPVVSTGTASVKSVNKRGWDRVEGSSGELWTQIQQVLSTLESSASRGRMFVSPHIHHDGKTQEHITAARESWVQATQLLEEMETELGITYTSALPLEERREYQKDVLALDKLNRELSANLQKRQEELKSTEGAILELEEEKKALREKLEDLKRKWLIVACRSPPRSPSLSSSRSQSPCWSSPSFPGSPMLSRRSPLSPPASPSPLSRSSSSIMETETERLQRCLERLKARNERLTAALERRKSESEQVSMALSRHEADCSALNMALTYCEECEEAYSDLLSLYEARKQQNAVLAESSTMEQADHQTAVEAESPCTLEDTAEAKHDSLDAQKFEDKSGVIWQRIARLKQDRAAVCIPEPSRTGEGKLSPDTGTLAGARRHSSTPFTDPKAEKATLLCELVNVREEMSELRGIIKLKEKEKRTLEFSLLAHRSQDSAGAAIADSLKEELEDRRAEQQMLDETQVKLDIGGKSSGPRNHAIMRELHSVLLREQTLKRRVTFLRESLDSTLLDCSNQRRVSKEEVAHLSACHNKALSAYRNARRKHHEQLWRLERQVTAMGQRQTAREAELKATLEELEWKREETVL